MLGVGRGREILLMMDRMGKRMTMELGAPLGTSYDCLHFKGMEVRNYSTSYNYYNYAQV